MTFREAIAPYFDGDRLIAREPNSVSLNTEGNPVLETGNAYAMLKWLGEDLPGDSSAFFDAIRAFEKEPGLPNKKPRFDDAVSHDDLIGYVVGSVAMNCAFHHELIVYGERHGWLLSNTGKEYWDSIAKPWHIAFYYLAANQQPMFMEKILLAGSIIWDSFFRMDSASDKRLTYLMLKTISGRSRIIDLASKLWWARIRRVYGGARRIFVILKGEKHPFSLFCPD